MTVKMKFSGDNADVAAALLRAIPARDKLAKVSDKLNGGIVRTEAAFTGLKLGVRGSVTMFEDPDGSFTNLVWGKFEGDWHLLIEEGHEHRPDEERLTLLTSAPRWVRQSAIKHLDELVIDMTKNIDGEIKRIEECTVEIEAFADRLEKWRQQNLGSDRARGDAGGEVPEGVLASVEEVFAAAEVLKKQTKGGTK